MQPEGKGHMSSFIDLATPAELALDFSRWVGDIILIPEKRPKMTDLLLQCPFWKLPAQNPTFLLSLLLTEILQPCLLGGLSPFPRGMGKVAVAFPTGSLAQISESSTF